MIGGDEEIDGKFEGNLKNENKCKIPIIVILVIFLKFLRTLRWL